MKARAQIVKSRYGHNHPTLSLHDCADHFEAMGALHNLAARFYLGAQKHGVSLALWAVNVDAEAVSIDLEPSTSVTLADEKKALAWLAQLAKAVRS